VIRYRPSRPSGSTAGRWAAINGATIMSHIYVPSKKPKEWKQFLADPKKHWKKGYSAYELAYRWQESEGFPEEVIKALSESSIPNIKYLEMLFGIPEHKVYFPPSRGRPSQNDLFVLARTQNSELVTIMVEGKVSETFGPTLNDWLKDKSPGKQERYEFIKSKLHITTNINQELRYQLFHRLLSVVLEMERYDSAAGIMLIHSFSNSNECFDDYVKFISLFSVTPNIGKIYKIHEISGKPIYSGWVYGNKK
jgi:hypothetical protein